MSVCPDVDEASQSAKDQGGHKVLQDLLPCSLHMAEYGSRRSQQPANVNFEPILKGLESDIFDSDQVSNPFPV